jgi:hypothetical protein
MPDIASKYSAWFSQKLGDQYKLLKCFTPDARMPFHRQAMLVYCILWDRAIIPLEFWTTQAAVPYFKECLRAASIEFNANEDTLRQWIKHSPGSPPVVTGWSSEEGITGFNIDAFIKHGIPEPPDVRS